MNFAKRLLALGMAAVMVLCFAGCHKKDEIAITVGEWEFTSAYYMCSLIYADIDAKSTVDEQLAEKAEEDESVETENIDYYEQKIDDMSFVDYVEKEARNIIKRVAAYKTKCKENDLKFEDDMLTGMTQYAEMFWTNYGYQQIFEENGVSKDTFLAYMQDTYYSTLYFEFLYGEGGEREVAADEINKIFNEHFVVANVLTASFDSETTEEQKTATKEQFDTYANDISSGALTFEEAYHTHNGTEHEEEATTDTEEQEEGSTPQDSHAQILGSEDTTYASDHFDTVKSMAVGEVKVVTEESGGVTLLVKKDMSADPYYLKTLDMTCRKMIAGDELEEEMDKYAKELDYDESKYATGQFKVKKIVYPETQA